MYKIIALDLDGTLFNNKKEITPENKKAIKEAQELGVKIVIATGRPYKGVLRVIKELGLENTDNYAMCFNGAVIYHLLDNSIVHNIYMKGSVVKELYKHSLELDVNIHAFTKNQDLISPKQSKYTDHEAEINDIKINYLDFNSINDNDLFIKAMFVDPVEKMEIVVKEMNQDWYTKCSTVRSAPFFLEFLDSNATKGKSLLALADTLNIDHKLTMAFGDAMNDYSMIESAAMGVVMENGVDTLKSISNYITKSNEESGVAYAINKFILNK